MSSGRVTVPECVKPKEVDTMLPLYQRLFGVKYDYRNRPRQVNFTGEQPAVDDACSALRAAFAKLELRVRDPGSPASSSFHPISYRCDFFFAAAAASSRSWQFKRLAKTPSDANTNRFPFELVAVSDPRPSESTSARRDDIGVIANRFFVDFDDAYIAAAAELLSQHPQSGSLFVKAVFGRKLFRAMRPGNTDGAVFSRAEVLQKHRDRTLQSMWSNVCDDMAPRLSALIRDIEAAARRSQLAEPTEQVTVHLKLSGLDGRVVARYERDPAVGACSEGTGGGAGVWQLVQCFTKTGNRIAHDITLHDGVSFRVRAVENVHPSDSALERVLRCVEISEPKDASDVYSARVRVLDSGAATALSSPATRAVVEDVGMEIEWVSVKTELAVPFKGLLFTLVRLRDEVQLEAELPDSEENGVDGDSGGAANRVNDRFCLLLSRLLSVLDRY